MAIYIGSSKKAIRVGSSITRTLLIPELVSIVVTAPPTQTEYNPFTSFNPAGMVVTAEYDNGEKKAITDYTITNGDYLTADMTSVTISYTARGITKTATQGIRVNHIKLNIPYSNDTFVYTGSEMAPVWTGYDSSLMTIGGDTSGTNAGTYSTNFALKDKINYTWADGTTADKSVTWTIGKAQASITLDKTSVVLNSDKLEETVTFSSVGMKSVMVMSSDMSVATVSMDGNVITISSVNETTGTANIIISGEVNSNYNAPEYPMIAVSAEFVKIVEMILRPASAMGSVSPSGLSTVEAISEEVTDDSTYIYGTVKAASGTSSPMSYTNLNVSFNETKFAGKLISAYMIIRRGKEGVSIQSESAYASAMMVANGGAAGTILPDTAANGYTDYQYTFGDTAIASINEYIIANGKLPNFVWQGQFGHNNPGGSMTVKISQAYVVLIYEEPKEIAFTINGTQYYAYETMTWNDWNDSDFNTSGQKVASVTDANGNSVSLDAVIVDGTAYEVGFAPPIVTTIFRPSSASAEYVYPSGMGYAEAISEEVSDGDATYIYSDVPQASGTSSPMQYSQYNVDFLQDGANFGGTVTSGYIVIRRDGSPQRLTDSLNIAGTWFTVTAEAFDDGTGGSWSGYRFVLNDSMLACMNDYIASNGKFPLIRHYCEIGGNNPGKGYTIKLTQAYLSLAYEGR